MTRLVQGAVRAGVSAARSVWAGMSGVRAVRAGVSAARSIVAAMSAVGSERAGSLVAARALMGSKPAESCRLMRGSIRLIPLLLLATSTGLWADESLYSGSSSAKNCADFLLKSQSPIMERLKVVILPEMTEVSEAALHVAESLRLQTYGKSLASNEALALRDLFKSLRISNRKFLEFKNAVIERHYLPDSPLVQSDFQLIEQDLEYWLEHLSAKYLSDLLLSLDYAVRGEGRHFVLSRSPMETAALSQAPWASQAWVKYSFQDDMHSLYGQFWVVEGELPQQLDGLGLFYLQELYQLVQQVQVAIDGHLKLLPLLANFTQHVAGLQGSERARQSEELFVTAGLVHERMEQLLNRIFNFN